MADNYPKRFNISKINNYDRQILLDFFERREIFDKYLKENNIKFFTCPGCGYPTLRCERGSYEICIVCYWEDDGQDLEKADEIWGGPNSVLSLTENRLIIGRRLKRLADNLKGSINLSLDEILPILDNLEGKINRLRKNVPIDAYTNQPIWSEYEKLEDDLLSKLIKL